MKKSTLLSTIVISLVLSGCSGIKVVADQDENTDFSKYKTYSFLGWQKNSDQILNKFDKERMYSSFDEEFTKRGLSFVEKDGDMAVSLYLVLSKETSVTAYTDHYGGMGYGRYSTYGYGWGGGYSTTTYSESDYLKGILVMDVFDEESGDQVWQGIVTRTVNENPAKREKTIPQNVGALMYKFPIKPKK